MRGQYEELAYSFCDKSKIQVWYIPSVATIKGASTATFDSQKHYVRSKYIWMIQSGCNVCDKTQEEVEKELRKQNVI